MQCQPDVSPSAVTLGANQPAEDGTWPTSLHSIHSPSIHIPVTYIMGGGGRVYKVRLLPPEIEQDNVQQELQPSPQLFMDLFTNIQQLGRMKVRKGYIITYYYNYAVFSAPWSPGLSFDSYIDSHQEHVATSSRLRIKFGFSSLLLTSTAWETNVLLFSLVSPSSSALSLKRNSHPSWRTPPQIQFEIALPRMMSSLHLNFCL